MSSWCPTSTPMPLPEAKTEPPIKPRLIILHSQAGVGSLFGYWLNGTSLESHWWVALNGQSEQYMPADRQADANYLANDFALSIETENHLANVRAQSWNEDPWTSAQIEEMATICAWAHKEWGIPLVQATSWDGSGIGYHIQFGSPGKWTNVAKACPGRKRIEQVPLVIRRARELAAAGSAPRAGIGPRSSEAAIKFLQVCLNLAGQEMPVTGVYDTKTGQAVRNLKAFFNEVGLRRPPFDLSRERGWVAGPVFLKTLGNWLNFLKSKGAF